MISWSPMFLSIITVSLIIGTVVARLSISPLQSTVNNGSTVTIKCTTDIPLSTAPCWKYNRNNIQLLIYNGSKVTKEFNGRFSVSNVLASSYSRLTIKSVLINDTGSYVCVNCGDSSDSASSQIDVVASLCTSTPKPSSTQPNIAFNDVGIFEVNCQVKYSYALSSGVPMVNCTPPPIMSSPENCGGSSSDCRKFVSKYVILPGTKTRYTCVTYMGSSNTTSWVSPVIQAEYVTVLSFLRNETQSGAFNASLTGGLGLFVGLVSGFVLGFLIKKRGGHRLKTNTTPLSPPQQDYEDLEIGTRELVRPDYSELTNSKQRSKYDTQSSSVNSPVVSGAATDYLEIQDYNATESYVKNVAQNAHR